MAARKTATSTTDETAIEKTSLAMTNRGLTPATLEEAWRYATALSRTAFVPEAYRGKPEDCLIAIDTAMRLRVAPLMLLQNTYIVHGRPGVEAKLVIALVNNSGSFTDPLEYEVEGDDPAETGYRVRAHATRASTGKVLYGPWITWDIVKAEGWHSKQGSKWKTMPGLMFAYRAAAWFARMHCPEVLMGMQTIDEIEDLGERRQVESRAVPDAAAPPPSGIAAAKERLAKSKDACSEDQQQPTDDDDGVKDDAPAADDDEHLYYCPQCDEGFDHPVQKQVNGGLVTAHGSCGSPDIVAWDER